MASLRWKIAQYFEAKWWKRYLGQKPVGAYREWKANYWKGLLESVELTTQQTVKGKVLDAGCGPAGIFLVLADCEVTAIDPLMGQYNQLAHFNPAMAPYASFHQMRMEDIAWKEAFDWVFCMNAINHVEDIKLSMQQLSASLKPHGHLVLSVDAHKYNWLRKVFHYLPGDVMHPHQLGLPGYLDLAKAAKLHCMGTILIKEEPIFQHYLCVFRRMA
ncbi:MAG: class I SAM-dependent methyltransferase [Chitinophagales bacterium]|nr:class I SAM-dependent methyltransferase [Chitinophagales bacterium]